MDTDADHTRRSDSKDSSGSDSEYHSLPDSSDEEDDDEAETTAEQAKAEATWEQERRLVLEAAGLIVKRDANPPPRPRKRRPAPPAPNRAPSVAGNKDLPEIPTTQPESVDHAARLDDAFDRYEAFRHTHGESSLRRLSTASTIDTLQSGPLSPASITPSQSRDGESRGYSHLLNFLSRNKTPTESEKPRSHLVISGPIMNPNDLPSRENSPAFGSVSANQQLFLTAPSKSVSLDSPGQVWSIRQP
jgi:actin cytoskeleton-regulatory complex protein PAN1